MMFVQAHAHVRAVSLALGFSLCLAAIPSATADATAEFSLMYADYKAQRWEQVRDRNVHLLTTQRDQLTDRQATYCYQHLAGACMKLEPREFDTIIKGLDALLSKPDMPMTPLLAKAINISAYAIWGAREEEKAVQVVDKLLAHTKGQLAGMRSLYFIKARHLNSTKKTAEARKLFHDLLWSEQCTGPLGYAISQATVDCIIVSAKADGDWGKAGTDWVRTVVVWDGRGATYDDTGETPFFRRFRLELLPKLKDAKATAAIVGQAAAHIPRKIRAPRTCHELQKAIVLLHVRAGQKKEALAAAKTLYQTCPADRFDAVVDYIADMLKRMDGSIARANRFLDYVKFGTVGPDGKPGTEDDAVNPFPESVGEMPPTVADAYKEAIEGEWQETWEDKRCLAMLYRYMDEPKKALELLADAFAVAPMKPEPLQLVAGDMANVLIQLTGNPADGDRLAQFLKFGREGKDGKAGTEDDVVDPREPYLKRG